MAKGIEVAQAYVTIIPSMKGIQGDIAKQLDADSIGSDAGKRIGGGIASGIAGAAGTVAAAVAKTVAAGTAVAAASIAAMSKASLDSYADYEQLAGGVEKLYGTSADTIKQYALDAYKTTGLSANEYMTQATSFSAALIKSVGGDTAEAARLTDIAMRAMSDNINTFGSNAADVQNAFQGFAKQNYTMLDNLKLGYAGTQQGMMQLINDSGVLGYTLTDTSQLAEVGFGTIVEAIQAVQEQQHIAGTTAKEAASTISGSIDMTKSAWANLLTELGKDDGDVSARVEELVDSALLVIENAAPRVVKIVGALIEKVPEAIEENAPKVIEAMTTLLDGMTDGAFSRVVATFQDYAARLQPAFSKIGTAMSGLMERLAPLAPYAQQIGGALGSILVTAINLVADAISWLAPIVATLAEHALPILAAVLSTVADAFEVGLKAIEPFYDFISGVLADALDTIGQGIEDFVTLITDAFDFLFTSLGDIGSFLDDPLGTIKDFGKKAYSSITGTNKKVTRSASDTGNSVSKAFSKMSTSAQASFTAAEKTASSKMGALSKSVTSNTGTAATNAEKNSKRISTTWNKKYTMQLDSEASTTSAETKLNKFWKTWNKSTIQFNTSGDSSGVENKLWKFWNSWNKSTVHFYSSGDTSSADSSFSRLYSKWNNTTVKFRSATSNAAGGVIVQKHADGFIVNRPGSGVDITRHVAGEAGAEAIIPLTNKQYVRPFAETVASFIEPSAGGVTITGNTFIVRNDSDIAAIGRAISQEAERQRRAKL